MASRPATPLVEHPVQTRPSLLVPNRLHQTRGVHPDRGTRCAVCWADILGTEATYTHIDCMNAFHSVCLEPAITRGMNCPACTKSIHHENLYGALEEIDDFQMLDSIPPDMDDEVSKWLIRNTGSNLAENQELAEEARKPLLTIAEEVTHGAIGPIPYWNERRRHILDSRKNKTTPRADFKAQLDYHKECDAAAGEFQKKIREACQQFLVEDRESSEDFVYHMTSKRYLAHHDLWAHKERLQSLGEGHINNPHNEPPLSEQTQMNQTARILEEFEGGQEPLRHMLYGRQFIAQYNLSYEMNEARAVYSDTLKTARSKLDSGKWNDNPDDRTEVLRRLNVIDKEGPNTDTAPHSWNRFRQIIGAGWEIIRRIRG